jgi:oligopeptide/dipeptide ABC transporter ATP-binding protein
VLEEKSILKIKNLSKTYLVKRWFGKSKELHAVRGLDLSLCKGQTLALVGESGCGKSTLAKLIMGIEAPTRGSIEIHESANNQQIDLVKLSSKKRSQFVQMIFQDPMSSLNPRRKIRDSIAEPLWVEGKFTKKQISEKITKIIDRVGLRSDYLDRFPHMFSGGQRQRIAIARALITNPQILVCDEPVSALDVSVQAQVINFLKELQLSEKITMLFVSHDLSVVRYISDRVAVMYLGLIIEEGETEEVMQNPQHPYTRLLLESIPSFESASKRNSESRDFDSEKDFIAKELPSPLNLPSGCAFHPRCRYVIDKCKILEPLSVNTKSGFSTCHLVGKI